jgi:hypothetical protein
MVVVVTGAGSFWFYESNRTTFHFEEEYYGGRPARILMYIRRLRDANLTISFVNDTLGNTASSREYGIRITYFHEYHDPSIVLGSAPFMQFVVGILSAVMVAILYVVSKLVRGWQSGFARDNQWSSHCCFFLCHTMTSTVMTPAAIPI